ncbi:cytochrome C oxidase Cbb3 [Marinobacter adhaerens]|uniref:Cytochrome C oxidase Cbb3 n=1 Tax=Marinobacter adhaerens TaxID=1033846 RepID=A0A851HYH6_9GAMM|nr:cytochrome D1 domain-containing protein [Marinobacter adhaerens]NWN91001.1 cytochrome C oxidase Cbb3 [Marinobacter adhaerens]
MQKTLNVLMLSAGLLNAPLVMASTDTPTETLYQQHCASCHGSDRLGGMGPALLPENLSRLKQNQAEAAIREGRPATQMLGFADTLSDESITALADYIYQPPAQEPVWDKREIVGSHLLPYPSGSLPDTPAYSADMMNLFLVVEIGDHHVTLLDGDSMEPIHRFASRYALHGGPKYSPDGRYVYFGSRDGWITKYDLYNLKVVAEVRSGINMRNIAVSADGKHVLAANYLPHTLVLFDADNLDLLEIIPVENDAGESSRVSAVYAAPPRNSFIAALKDIPQAWEITVENNQARLRKMQTDTWLDDFFFDPDYEHLIGAARDGKHGLVINLDTGETTAELPLPGMPHLGSGITWDYNGSRVMATPHFRTGAVSIIDMDSWKVIKTLETAGPGFFMRSHENSRYAWVDVFFGPNKDKVHVIDKQTLEIVKTLQPEPGKVAAHVEFDREGKKLLLSIWDEDGAVIVYDADTLEEEKRIPMNKPSGKYNVWNKINYEEGTSH